MTRRRRDPGEGDPGPYPGTRYSASGGLVGEGGSQVLRGGPKGPDWENSRIGRGSPLIFRDPIWTYFPRRVFLGFTPPRVSTKLSTKVSGCQDTRAAGGSRGITGRGPFERDSREPWSRRHEDGDQV